MWPEIGQPWRWTGNDSTERPDVGLLRRLVSRLAEACGDPVGDVWFELGAILDAAEPANETETHRSIA